MAQVEMTLGKLNEILRETGTSDYDVHHQRTDRFSHGQESLAIYFKDGRALSNFLQVLENIVGAQQADRLLYQYRPENEAKMIGTPRRGIIMFPNWKIT